MSDDIKSKNRATGISATFIRKNVDSEANRKGRNVILSFSIESSLSDMKIRNKSALAVALYIFLIIVYHFLVCY